MSHVTWLLGVKPLMESSGSGDAVGLVARLENASIRSSWRFIECWTVGQVFKQLQVTSSWSPEIWEPLSALAKQQKVSELTLMPLACCRPMAKICSRPGCVSSGYASGSTSHRTLWWASPRGVEAAAHS